MTSSDYAFHLSTAAKIKIVDVVLDQDDDDDDHGSPIDEVKINNIKLVDLDHNKKSKENDQTTVSTDVDALSLQRYVSDTSTSTTGTTTTASTLASATDDDALVGTGIMPPLPPKPKSLGKSLGRQSRRPSTATSSTSTETTTTTTTTTSAGSTGSRSSSRSKTSDDDSAITARHPRRKSVQFSQVTVSQHAMILGDNVPSGGGAPVTIDWKPSNTHTYSLDDYEYETTSNSYRNKNGTGEEDGASNGNSSVKGAVADTSKRSKSKDEMRLTANERSDLLYGMGYTKQEVRRASQVADTKREQRQWTRETPDMQPIEEIVEKGIKVFKKPFLRFYYNSSMGKKSNVTMIEYHHPTSSKVAAAASSSYNRRRHSSPWNWKDGEKHLQK